MDLDTDGLYRFKQNRFLVDVLPAELATLVAELPPTPPRKRFQINIDVDSIRRVSSECSCPCMHSP